jgi:predicted Zn-dependent peptidase
MMIHRSLSVLLCLSGFVQAGQAGPQTFKLPTGLTCVLLENHDRPLVRMELKVRVAPAFLPWVQDGTVGFLARLLESTGAGTLGRPDFNRAADDLGLALAFEGRREAFQWTVLTDSRAEEQAMEFMANAVFRPILDSPALEAQRQVLIKKASTTPLREGAIARFLWAIQDPRATLEPGGAGLDHLELQEIMTLAQGLIRPERAELVLYGDLSLPQARELALLHLGVWGPSPVSLPVKAPPALSGPRFAALLEGGTVAELWVGAIRKDSERPELEEVLGLLLEGISLTPFDGLDLAVSLQPSGPMLLKATGGDAARATLVSGLVVALDLLRTKGFSDGDLARAKERWRARNEARPLHPEAMARRLLRGAEPVSASAVEAVTAKDVNAALAAWLEPERLRFLLLGGDAAMLQAGEKAGLGKAVLVKP